MFASQLCIIGTAAILAIGVAFIAMAISSTILIVKLIKKSRAKKLQSVQVQEKVDAIENEEVTQKTLVKEDESKLVNSQDLSPESNFNYVYMIDLKTGVKDDKSEFSFKTNNKMTAVESLIQDARSSVTTYLNSSVKGIDFKAKYKTESGEVKTFNKYYDMSSGNTLTDAFEKDVKTIVAGMTEKKVNEEATQQTTSTYGVSVQKEPEIVL